MSLHLVVGLLPLKSRLMAFAKTSALPLPFFFYMLESFYYTEHKGTIFLCKVAWCKREKENRNYLYFK